MEKQKTKIYGLFGIVLLLVVGMIIVATMSSKQKETVVSTPKDLIVSDKELHLAVISDLHIGSTSQALINPIGNYTNEIVDSFIDQIIQEDVDVVILCGDNSNSGRTYQHEEIITRFQKLLQHDITVLAIPGNHDIGETSTERFKEYYQNLGYNKAIAQDQDSLSYSTVIGRTLFLMIDTDGYTKLSQASLSKDTLKWIKEQLDYAKEKQLNVLPVGHYPLLTGNATPFINQKEMVELLEEYEIPLYICGHLHGRSVTSKEFTELVVEQTPSYPTVYADLIIGSSNMIQYQPITINVERYANKIDSYDQNLLHFNDYQQTMQTKWAKDTVDLIAKDHHLNQDELELARDFFAELLKNVYNGTLYRHLDTILEHPGRKIFEEIAKDTNYGPWLPQLYEKANPYSEGFMIEKGNLYELSKDENID